MPIDNVITCCLDDKDLAALDRLSEEMGYTRKQTVRYLIRLPKEIKEACGRDSAVIVIERIPLAQVCYQMRRIGGLLNQVAYAMNSIAKFHRENAVDRTGDYERRQLETAIGGMDILDGQFDEMCESNNQLICESKIFELGRSIDRAKREWRD